MHVARGIKHQRGGEEYIEQGRVTDGNRPEKRIIHVQDVFSLGVMPLPATF